MTVRAPVRVLHLVPDLLFGGLQRLVVQTVNRADPARVDARVLALGETGAPAADLRDPSRVLPPVAQSRFSLLRPARLAAAIRSVAPDVVHTHSGVWLKGARAARLARVPVVLHTDHGRRRPDPWIDRTVDRLASRHTDVVVAVSEILAAHLRQSVVAYPDRVRVVINGVDTTAIRPGLVTGVRAELGIPDDAFVVGSVGRLESIKGYDVMVEAFGVLVRQVQEPAFLIVAGDGAERPALEARAGELGLASRIRFLGWRQDPVAVLSALDVFALTSRSEGTSVSLLEAMSAGVCPVVTNVGGNAAVLGPDLAHRLVPSENPGAIAAGWAAAAASPGDRRRDARAARARVERGYSFDAMTEGYLALYLEALGKRPG